jgi:nucleotide-binding universal stress UspA family protein
VRAPSFRLEAGLDQPSAATARGHRPNGAIDGVPAREIVRLVSRILVGYDGTEAGRRALERAIDEARGSKARITVLSVANMPLGLDVPRNFGTLDDISPGEDGPLSPPPDVVAHLAEARDVLAAAGLDPDLAWAAGEPGHEIVETAKRIRARTIVLGEHHHGFLSNLFGDDVDEEVQREAGCTVILA